MKLVLILIILFITSCKKGEIFRYTTIEKREMLKKHSAYYKHIYSFNNFYNRKQFLVTKYKNNKLTLSTKLYKPEERLIETLEFSVKIKGENREFELNEGKKKVKTNKIKFFKSQPSKILYYPLEVSYKIEQELLNNDTILIEVKYLNLNDKINIDTLRRIYMLKDSIPNHLK